MFGITQETADNSNPKSLAILAPGIYNGTLEKVEFTNAEKKDGSQGKAILKFSFKTTDGLLFDHNEWELDETATATKIENMNKRVAHIMSKFMDKAKTVSPSFKTFAEFANWVVKTLTPTHKGVAVKWKIVGHVYNGKKTAGFPNYLGFIVKAEEPLAFSAGEITSNIEFSSFSPDANPDAAAPATVTDEF